MSDQGYSAAVGIFAGMTMTFLLIGLILLVLLIVARWKIFTKAGEEGWKSIIPIYSDYIAFKIAWDTTNFWIYLALSIGASFLTVMGRPATTIVNGDVITTGGNSFFMILGGIAYIGLLVWYVRISLKTAAAFGKGTGFGIGLALLPNIFTLILGFGSAEYVGPQE